MAALGLPAHKIRVVAPDVGGGFGTKANGYPEDLLIPAAAMATRRPVKWTEDRREHMMASAHARDQVHDIEIGARRDGTMLAVQDHIWVDFGAYNSWGIVLPYNTVAHLLGPHRVPTSSGGLGVVTNKTPMRPTAARGEPSRLRDDRLVDLLARELGMDRRSSDGRTISRRRPPYEIDSHRDGNPLVYDSAIPRGSRPPSAQSTTSTAAGASRAPARGIHRGIGLSGYVEAGLGPYEARPSDGPSGRAVVATAQRARGGAGDLVRPGGGGRARDSDEW